MENKKPRPIVPICYDFDCTLGKGNMQEFGLIQSLRKDKDTFWEPKDFWNMSNKYRAEMGASGPLGYLKLIADMAKDSNVDITENGLREFGKNIELYDGVDTWFDRINAAGDKIGVDIEHYIISCGMTPMVHGTKIADKLNGIFACDYQYDEAGNAVWPKRVIDQTVKTQYIARISKGYLDAANETDVNKFETDKVRHAPYRNMIYIGDSDTDVPAMTMLSSKGGHAIGVYDKTRNNGETVKRLQREGRIDFYTQADYRSGGEIEQIITNLLSRIKFASLARKSVLNPELFPALVDKIKAEPSLLMKRHQQMEQARVF